MSTVMLEAFAKALTPEEHKKWTLPSASERAAIRTQMHTKGEIKTVKAPVITATPATLSEVEEQRAALRKQLLALDEIEARLSCDVWQEGGTIHFKGLPQIAQLRNGISVVSRVELVRFLKYTADKLAVLFPGVEVKG